MATIIRGKLKGTETKIHQWCNDWFMVDPGGIVSPTQLKLSEDERAKILLHNNNGLLFGLFELRDDGTFRRIRREKWDGKL
jgi:hypothetical protein